MISLTKRCGWRLVLLTGLCLAFTVCQLEAQFGDNAWLTASKKSQQPLGENNDQCFCKLNGDVDECACTIESVDTFNNYKMYPRLSALVAKPYFRYVKMNLTKTCQFWPTDNKCTVKDCHVQVCHEEDLPNKLYEEDKHHENELDQSQKECESATQDPLGHFNSSLTDDNLATFEEWRKYDDAQDSFCEPDDEDTSKMEYADLLINPERYTGYKGQDAQRIWNSIYRENCFADDTSKSSGYGPERETCLEKRIFHRLISGLHASINTHLCSNFLHTNGGLHQTHYWGPNPAEFKKRFDPVLTNGQGPQWLKNIYFLYLVEFRAIAKAAPYLEKEAFYAGPTPKEDEETKTAVLEILNLAKSFKNHFDESPLFKTNSNLKEQFQVKFRNITKIMDCVGCDKCRLWGKLQTQALGTALKILFSGRINDATASTDVQRFRLSRSEIVALFNGFARLSHSISEIENFRELLSAPAHSTNIHVTDTTENQPRNEL